MPRLVDTTLRLLGQEPLAGSMPTADQLRLAEILDTAGFAYLEVSGGGCFDSAVKRGVESPWERIRAIKARTNTPLAMALRGRFLVGSKPVGVDFVRRFVASAADSGIDVFRLHDPLNDVSNLRQAAEAVATAGGEFEAGLVYSPGSTGETEPLVEQARELIDDVLFLGELETGREVVSLGTTPALPIVQEVVARYAGRAENAEVQLAVRGRGDTRRQPEFRLRIVT